MPGTPHPCEAEIGGTQRKAALPRLGRAASATLDALPDAPPIQAGAQTGRFSRRASWIPRGGHGNGHLAAHHARLLRG
jgi:hypothetical protein